MTKAFKWKSSEKSKNLFIKRIFIRVRKGPVLLPRTLQVILLSLSKRDGALHNVARYPAPTPIKNLLLVAVVEVGSFALLSTFYPVYQGVRYMYLLYRVYA